MGQLNTKLNVKVVLILVYFDIYDTDGDNKITAKDIRKILEIYNGKESGNGQKIENDIENLIEPAIQIIFKELSTGGDNLNFIDYNEFQNIMWNTNIDKTCTIYLEDD